MSIGTHQLDGTSEANAESSTEIDTGESGGQSSDTPERTAPTAFTATIKKTSTDQSQRCVPFSIEQFSVFEVCLCADLQP